jgi:hypothetical protein
MTEGEGGEAATVDTTAQAAVEAAVSSQETESTAQGGEAAERNWETEARDLGWVPKNEFKGDPTKWRDPEEFVKWGEEFLPFVRADNKKLRAELDTIKKSHTEEIGRFSKVVDSVKKRLEAEYADKVAKLETERKAAVKAGDTAEFDRIDAKLDQLKKDGPVETDKPQTAEQTAEQVQRDWQAKNTWYDTDDELGAYAFGYSNKLAAKNPSMSLSENLRLTEEHVKAKYPDKFGQKKAAANGHAAVDGGGAFPTAGGTREKSVDDLPSDARAAGERFVKDGTFKDMKAYAKSYWAEN